MSVMDFIVLLIIAGVCGSIGRAITGVSRGGCLVSIAIGFIGALLGGWIAHAMGMEDLFPVEIGGVQFPIIWSIIGGALFVAVLSLLTPRRPYVD